MWSRARFSSLQRWRSALGRNDHAADAIGAASAMEFAAMTLTRLSTRLGLVIALSLTAIGTVEAGEGFRHGGFHRGRILPPYGLGYAYGRSYGYGYGFADATVSGDYIGAPTTRFPRPNEIVPSAWGYGTYGIPTVAGIRQAPTAEPTVYVLDTPARQVRRVAAGPRILSRRPDGQFADTAAAPASHGGGARVVTVSVPGR